MNQEHSFGNLDEVPDGHELLPIAIYDLRSVEQEMKDTKDGTGSLLATTFEVISGPMQGRKLFVNFNLVNKNEKAVEIALRDIKSWMAACGLPTTGELTMAVINRLEGKAFAAKVGLDKDKTGQYDDTNKISRFIKPDGAAQPPGGVAQPPTSAAPGSNKKPWE